MSNCNLNPRCLNIGGKEIRVVDDHQYVLLIWGSLFQNRKQPMVLVSIDYHPDTNPPFWLWAYQKAMAIDPEREAELVGKFQRRMLAALEPLIIIILGMVVAFIIISILGGVLSINDTI